MEIRQWEQSCSMRADVGQTGMTKLTVVLRNFANVPKNQIYIPVISQLSKVTTVFLS